MDVVIIIIITCSGDEFSLYRQQDTTFDNPTYDITAFTPTQYSSHGPEAPPDDTSATVDTSATSPTYATVKKKTSKKQRKIMQSAGNVMPMTEWNMGGEGEVGGDVEYQVLGVATYEVPVPAETSVQPPAAATNTATQDDKYSTLKYN